MMPRREDREPGQHDRDINAAINIKQLGLAKPIRSGQELPVEPAVSERKRSSPATGKIEIPREKEMQISFENGIEEAGSSRIQTVDSSREE